MENKIKIAIGTLKAIQTETQHAKADSKLYWVDHYIENATMELRKALSTLKRT